MTARANDRVDLATLLANPARASDVRPDQLQPLLYQLAALQAMLASRLAALSESPPDQQRDTLLSVEQAATRLGLSQDWLDRHSRRLPFTVRVGRHLRFSAQGIDRYIRQRQGR